MKSRQLLQLRACRASSAVIQKYLSVWEGNLGFVRIMGMIRESIVRIGSVLGYKEGDRTGIAKSKAKIRVDAINLALTIGGQIKGWAYLQQDLVVSAKVEFTQTSLSDLGAKLPYHLIPLLATAREALAGGAGDFGLTQASIDQLGQMVALLDERDIAPQVAGVERKTATEELAEAIAKLYEQFGEAVDPMMRQFREAHPTFYTEYTNARRIGGRSRDEKETETETEKEDAKPTATGTTQAVSHSQTPSPAESDAETEADAAEVQAEAESIRREATIAGPNGAQATLPG